MGIWMIKNLWNILLGMKMGFYQKVWKRKMLSAVVYAHVCWTNAKLNIRSQGGSGGPPPEFVRLLGSQMVHSSAILGHCTPIPLPLPPPLQIFFYLQVYTDLKSSPGSWKKVWHKTKVWTLWSLPMGLKNTFFSFIKQIFSVYFSLQTTTVQH